MPVAVKQQLLISVMFWCLSLCREAQELHEINKCRLFRSIPVGISVVICRHYLRVERVKDEVNEVAMCFCGRQWCGE